MKSALLHSTIFLFILTASISLGSCTDPLCDNTCPFANDNVCDDGGEGAEHDVCQLGTDCNDCGEREE